MTIWKIYDVDGTVSVWSILSSQFPFGLPEESIAVVLRACVIGLSCFHNTGEVLGDINADHIFLNQESSEVELDFGPSGSYEDYVVRGAFRAATWTAAPEVYHSSNYTLKADIWQIGFTALELAYGGLRVDNRLALEAMLVKMITKNRLPEKDEGETSNGKRKSFWKRLVLKKRAFSKDFEKFVFQCLQWNPAERPTVRELLRCRFITNAPDEAGIKILRV